MRKTDLPYTYEKYRMLLQGLSNLEIRDEETGIIQKFNNELSRSSPFAPVIYLLDYTTNKYLYVDEGCFNLFGYTATQWIEDGVDAFLSRWHPQDVAIMNRYIFPENLRFLQTLSLDDYEHIIFTFNYRVLNPKGEYITILQRSSYIPGKIIGKPVASIGAAYDITHFKKELSIVHTIEEVKTLAGRPFAEMIYKKVYPLEKENLVSLSKREREILEFMAAGLSSKQIANEFSLSINTIHNHRKNMLQKTGSKSSAELIKYASRHGLL